MKKIAITMGEPGGIGPEVIVKALYNTEISSYCSPLIIGSQAVIKDVIKLLGLSIRLKSINDPDESSPSPGAIEIIDVGDFNNFEKGRPTPEGGKASVSYIKRAVEFALDKKIDGIVTAPISKEALKMAGFNWPGHTEMLAELTGTKNFAMMLTGDLLRVILVTTHTSIKKVPDLITKERVLGTIRLSKKACDMLGILNPKIAVAGLNPHAGEAGIFGDEEIAEIRPAVEEACKEGIPAEGPFPPDTIFHRAYKGEIDIIVCMYHDQGLIPLKMIAFEEGINVTVGLPIIRTSPDHGTAYDIAWKGLANPSSILEAIKLASRLKI